MINRGSLDGFEKIVGKYHAMVFRTAVGFVHCREDAEDIAQDVFLRAYQSWEKFRGEAEISTWLYRITVNVSLNHLSRKKRRNFLYVGEIFLNHLFNKADSAKNCHQTLEIAERDHCIRQAIDALSDRQKTAFILRYYDEFSQKEIASIMRLSEGAVEQLLQRAKSNLQKKLEKTIGKNNY
jgi:RNA polymerase sigma-70 factor (ECF subfamily)